MIRCAHCHGWFPIDEDLGDRTCLLCGAELRRPTVIVDEDPFVVRLDELVPRDDRGNVVVPKARARWSGVFDCCLSCESVKRPHKGKGLCMQCHAVKQYEKTCGRRPKVMA